MKQIYALFAVCLLCACLLLGGCEQMSQSKPEPQPAPAPKELQVPLRYELHEIRNGGFLGTALLDKKTGRIWTLSNNTKGGHVSDPMFSEVPIYPQPER